MLALVAVLALLLVARPLALRLGVMPGVVPEPALAGAALAAPDGTGALPPGAEEEMVSLSHVEGQLRAASIRRLADLVERHPDYVLSLVRGWMMPEE